MARPTKYTPMSQEYPGELHGNIETHRPAVRGQDGQGSIRLLPPRRPNAARDSGPLTGRWPLLQASPDPDGRALPGGAARPGAADPQRRDRAAGLPARGRALPCGHRRVRRPLVGPVEIMVRLHIPTCSRQRRQDEDRARRTPSLAHPWQIRLRRLGRDRLTAGPSRPVRGVRTPAVRRDAADGQRRAGHALLRSRD